MVDIAKTTNNKYYKIRIYYKLGMPYTEVEGGNLRTLEILTFIFVLGLVGLSWPLLEIFRSELVAYLFLFWLAFIISVAFIVSKSTGYKKT
jgi:hypothetical protein